MRRITTFSILFLVAFALLAAASAVPARAASDVATVPANGDAAKAPSGEGGGKKPDDVSGGRFEGDPVYVHLAPILLPVISDEGAEQIVTLVIDVEVKDFNVADAMHTKMPKVRDSLMTALYGGLGHGTLRNGKLVDVTKIKAKVTAALNQVMGTHDDVREVLVQGVAQRML